MGLFFFAKQANFVTLSFGETILIFDYGIKGKTYQFFIMKLKVKLINFWLWDLRQNLLIFDYGIEGKTYQFLIMELKAKLINFW